MANTKPTKLGPMALAITLDRIESRVQAAIRRANATTDKDVIAACEADVERCTALADALVMDALLDAA